MKTVFFQTIQLSMRIRHLQFMAGLFLVLNILVALNTSIAYRTREESFDRARHQVRSAWLNQGERNPHSSAHYGHYIFQPVDAMQFLDNGIRQFSGSVLRLEAHAQHEAGFAPAEDTSEMSRMGELNFAWLLQVLTPLFIILLCFNAVSQDRESQNLKMMAIQGISMQQYLWGRITANYSISLLLVISGLLIQGIAFALFTGNFGNLLTGQLLFWFVLYAVYIFIITTASVLISSQVKYSRSSLVLQLALWVLLVVIVPRITANAGEAIYPQEHKTEFNRLLREDREKGIDGHNPRDERSRNFMDSLKKHYKVDSVKHLPVNADGLRMQADEDYANMVYDKHFSRIRRRIQQQNSISSTVSLFNPYLAIRNLSMTVSQSDYHSQLDLFAAAEQYRRYLIRELNHKMAYGGSKTGDWDWTTNQEFWKTIRDFDYPQTSLGKRLYRYRPELISLLFWLLCSLIAVKRASTKITVL